MAATKRVGILTGGGDVPGLNMCLKSLVYRAIDLGFEPIGVRKGWEGLIHYNPDSPSTYSDHFIELTKNIVRPIDRTSGSFLHSSRLDPRQTPHAIVPEHLRTKKQEPQDLTRHIMKAIERLGYQALIVIGDDDTLHYAAHLSKLGVPIIAIPKTIHNNILGTDYTLGFSTGLMRGVAFIHELRALAGSREQLVVLETFAAKSGYSTLLMALLAGVDRVLIPEVEYDPDQLAYLITQDKRQTPANYAVMLVCNGARPALQQAQKYAHLLSPDSAPELSQPPEHGAASARAAQKLSQETLDGYHGMMGSGMIASQLMAHITGEEVFLQSLTYLLRTGPPDGQDLLGAANFALTAARLLAEGKHGRLAAFVQDRMWCDVDIQAAVEGVKTVDVETWYDRQSYKPRLELIWSVNPPRVER
ncbi:MAG: 6-phosphofructokinase [Anaerolineales bacterium]|nr:6-phosphofructokinase [Anaerolineales bacterium]